MTNQKLDLIDLKWTFRDILANRRNLARAKADHLKELAERGFIDMTTDFPTVTEAGLRLLD